MIFARSSIELAAFAKNQRKNLKLSQSDVGKLVGLGQKTISAFENNPETVQLKTFVRILSALNLDITLVDKSHSQNQATEWREEW